MTAVGFDRKKPASPPRFQPAPLRGLGFVLVILILTLSRLLPIPGEPWEQDEALFAAAAFNTDLAQHHPHPPGFPLWVAAGKLGLWLVGDPVLALQTISALASVVTIPLLAWLWSAALGSSRLGWSAALLYAFLPGVWFHAPRAFTTTPALAATAAAALVWLQPGRRPLVFGGTLLAVAILLRPILAIPLLALAAAAVWLRRDRPRDFLTAAVIGALCLVIGFAPLVVDSGGPGEFIRLVSSHGSEHGGALHLAPWTFAGLGVVRALGGPAVAVSFSALFVLGLWRLTRRDQRLPWALLAVFAITLGWVLLAHNRTYTRYTLPAIALATGPAVLGLASLLRSRRLTAVVTGVAAAASAVWTAPALVAVATERFPPLAALESAQRKHDVDLVVVDGALSPFGDLLAIAGRARVPILWRPLLAEDRVPETLIRGRWAYVRADGTPSAAVPPPHPPAEIFVCDQPRLKALAQDRFLSTEIWHGGGIVLEPTYPRTRRGTAVWLDGRLRMLLQPTPANSWLGIALTATESGGTIQIDHEGETAGEIQLKAGQTTLHLPLPKPPARGEEITPSSVVFDRAEAPGSVLLEKIWLDTPGGPPPPRVITPEQQVDGLAGRVSGDGFYRVEKVGSPPRAGRWTQRSAWISVPAARGQLALRMTTPGARPAQVHVSCEQLGWSTDVVIRRGWRDPVIVPIDVPLTRVVLRFETTNAFVPAELNPASGDRRVLGVMLGDVAFEPASQTLNP